jgi:hypothetical protein
MSSRLRQTLLLSLEDETSVEVPVVETGADSLEGELAGVIAADQEVVDTDQAVEDLTDVQATLESLAITVEQSLADGGLTPREAALVEQVYQASAGRVGLKSKVPSMESFGGSSDRERATRVTLEGFKERVQQVWQAILNILKKWWIQIDKFFYSVFNAAPKLMGRANALALAASKHTDEVNVGAKLKLSGVHAELAGGNAVQAANDLRAVTADIFEKYSKEMISYGEACASYLKGVDAESDEKFDASAYKIGDIAYPVPSSCSVTANPSDFGAGGQHKVKTTKPLPGGKVLAVVYADSKEKYQEESGVKAYLAALAGSKATLVASRGHEEAKEGEHAPLSKENIITMAKDVAAIAQDVVVFQRGYTGTKKVREALEAAGNEYSKKDGSKLTGERVSLAAELPKLVSTAGKGVDAAQRALAGYVISTGAAMIQLGEQSLKQHGGKKEAPAAKPAEAGAAA